MINCERPSAAVPRDLPLDGLSPADLAQLGMGDLNKERSMNEQWMGVVRHVMTTIGAVLITMGVMDTGTWTTVSGAVLALVPIVWSWYSNSVPSMVSAVAESDEVERVVLTNARMAAEDPSPKVVAA